MSGHVLQGPFDIPEMTNAVPRRLKPWVFILFLVIIQLSGGLYLAAASDMVGTTALMQEDILMAGYAQIVGMSVNFAVMFRLKFRFSGRTGLLLCGMVIMGCCAVCAVTDSVVLLVTACAVAGWFRMWATFICNSTIQLWLTPVRDMSVFFCFVYLVVDGAIQLSGIAAVYTAFYSQWEYMHLLVIGLLAVMLVLVLILLKPMRAPMFIPLLGIDWLGGFLWGLAALSFTFVCVYGNFYDWWDSAEITGATVFGFVCIAVNLWRATFLHHPYISFQAMTNRNVVRASLIYVVFYTLLGTEHVFEHTYASTILGFDETNLIDLNFYVLVGILAGVALTYWLFCRRRWRYKHMTALSVAFLSAYLAYFYFLIDYGIEKEMLFMPLMLRGISSVILSIVLLTSIVQSGLHFLVFPQALVINGFMGAVVSAAFGPAVIGEWFRHVMASNMSMIGSVVTDVNPVVDAGSLGDIAAMISRQAMVVSMKEIYGWLLIASLVFITVIALSYAPLRPSAIFPKWRTIRKAIRGLARAESREALKC